VINLNIDKKQPDIRVKSTPAFKLKDKIGRSWQALNLIKQFGFAPETIIIEKVRGQNNIIIVRAVMTPDEIKKEENAKEMMVKPS
jgi:hypothetical protein